jgi:hypothetical protein
MKADHSSTKIPGSRMSTTSHKQPWVCLRGIPVPSTSTGSRMRRTEQGRGLVSIWTQLQSSMTTQMIRFLLRLLLELEAVRLRSIERHGNLTDPFTPTSRAGCSSCAQWSSPMPTPPTAGRRRTLFGAHSRLSPGRHPFHRREAEGWRLLMMSLGSQLRARYESRYQRPRVIRWAQRPGLHRWYGPPRGHIHHEDAACGRQLRRDHCVVRLAVMPQGSWPLTVFHYRVSTHGPARGRRRHHGARGFGGAWAGLCKSRPKRTVLAVHRGRNGTSRAWASRGIYTWGTIFICTTFSCSRLKSICARWRRRGWRREECFAELRQVWLCRDGRPLNGWIRLNLCTEYRTDTNDLLMPFLNHK